MKKVPYDVIKKKRIFLMILAYLEKKTLLNFLVCYIKLNFILIIFVPISNKSIK